MHENSISDNNSNSTNLESQNTSSSVNNFNEFNRRNEEQMPQNEQQMDIKIGEYISRFIPNGFEKPNWSAFFTQLELISYHQILPYIFQIELFNFRLLKAYLLKESICIYSDYDTDAVTATATMYHGLIQLGFDPEKISFYAPDRFTEGYGMNTAATEELAKNYDLIISVDCGINSRAEADLVNQMKVLANSNASSSDLQVKIADLIITDHHQLVGSIPEALAVVNPRLNSIYAGNPELVSILKNKIQNQKTELFEWLESKPNLLDTIKNENSLDAGVDQDNSSKLEKIKFKIQNWVEKTEHNPKNFALNSPAYLTSSATGVAVAWFCLVWLGYFMEECLES